VTAPAAAGPRALPAGRAWRNALGIVAVLWVVLGVGCFGLGAQLVADRYGHSLDGAFALDLVFLAGVLVVIAAAVGWQRAHGETLRDLGWRAPPRPVAVVVAVVFGLVWTASSYARGGDVLALFWQRPVMAVIGVVLAFGEELAVRGFFLEQLRRGGVPTWLQVVASGRRGPALAQQRRPLAERLGQATSFGPAPRHAPHHLLDHRAVQRRFLLGDQVNDDPDRVGENLGSLGHRSPVDPPVMRARLGRSSPTPASTPPAALDLPAGAAVATGSIRSVIEQSRMSSSAISTLRLNRSGRSVTSR